MLLNFPPNTSITQHINTTHPFYTSTKHTTIQHIHSTKQYTLYNLHKTHYFSLSLSPLLILHQSHHQSLVNNRWPIPTHFQSTFLVHFDLNLPYQMHSHLQPQQLPLVFSLPMQFHATSKHNSYFPTSLTTLLHFFFFFSTIYVTNDN